jgi:hypothetical protein
MDGKIEAIADCDYRTASTQDAPRVLNSVTEKKAKIQRWRTGSAQVHPRRAYVALALCFCGTAISLPRLYPGAEELRRRADRRLPLRDGHRHPLAVTITVGAWAKSGIFVRNPPALETLAKVDAVVSTRRAR